MDGEDEKASAQEANVLTIRPGLILLQGGEFVMALYANIDEWVNNSRPRWTPGRGCEVLAEDRILLPGRALRILIQAYIGPAFAQGPRMLEI